MTTLNKTPNEADDATALALKSTPKESKVYAFLFSVVAFVLVSAVLGIGYSQFKSNQQGERCYDRSFSVDKSNVALLENSDRTYDLEIAKTTVEHEKGLSGRDCLPIQSVLLFEFATSDSYGIWMKDMKFAIDVVWLDQNKKIVGIEENLQPETYPNTFYPGAPAMYVLESSTGFVRTLGLETGTQLQW